MNTSGPRVLLCESRTLVRQGLSCLLEQAGFRVVAEAADGYECLAHTCRTRPDVVVADPRSCDGAARGELLNLYPATKIVLLTGGDGGSRGAEPGPFAHAVVAMSADAATLSVAIRRICGEAGGEPVASTPAAPCLNGAFPGLKARDQAILWLLATGRTNREIGSALGIAEKTVRIRLTEIFAAIRVRNRTEAALCALGHHNLYAEAQPERLVTTETLTPA